MPPALRSYMNRINANQTNFKRWHVREYKGHYYSEKTVIKIADNGTIECKGKNHKGFEPTEAEQEEITKQWKEMIAANPLPVMINASDGIVNAFQHELGLDYDDAHFFKKFFDRSNTERRTRWCNSASIWKMVENIM